MLSQNSFQGHRTLYVGVRMPLGRQSHRHHRTHGGKHRKRDRMKGVIQEEGHDESLAHGKDQSGSVYAAYKTAMN